MSVYSTKRYMWLKDDVVSNGCSVFFFFSFWVQVKFVGQTGENISSHSSDACLCVDIIYFIFLYTCIGSLVVCLMAHYWFWLGLENDCMKLVGGTFRLRWSLNHSPSLVPYTFFIFCFLSISDHRQSKKYKENYI